MYDLFGDLCIRVCFRHTIHGALHVCYVPGLPRRMEWATQLDFRDVILTVSDHQGNPFALSARRFRSTIMQGVCPDPLRCCQWLRALS